MARPQKNYSQIQTETKPPGGQLRLPVRGSIMGWLRRHWEALPREKNKIKKDGAVIWLFIFINLDASSAVWMWPPDRLEVRHQHSYANMLKAVTLISPLIAERSEVELRLLTSCLSLWFMSGVHGNFGGGVRLCSHRSSLLSSFVSGHSSSIVPRVCPGYVQKPLKMVNQEIRLYWK